MRRREFIAGLAGAAAWPLAARAQQSDRMRRIGVLMGEDGNDLWERPAFPRSRRDLRSRVGPKAETYGWTFVGPTPALTGYGCSQRNSWE
jgi:hypothetical protein